MATGSSPESAPDVAGSQAAYTEGIKDPKEGSKNADINASTTVSNMQELKEKAPEVYEQTLESIATNMISQLNDANERLLQRMREARQGR